MSRAPAGFRQESKLLPPEAVFTRHVRCLARPGLSQWDPDTARPLCSDEEVLRPDPRWGGVPVCPLAVVQGVRARHNLTA